MGPVSKIFELSHYISCWNLNILYPCQPNLFCSLKFGHYKRPQTFETISHLIWHLLSIRQIKWEMVSKFRAFLLRKPELYLFCSYLVCMLNFNYYVCHSWSIYQQNTFSHSIIFCQFCMFTFKINILLSVHIIVVSRFGF